MAERPLRPRELEDPLNYHVYHPLAWQLARRLAGTRLTPNMVSVCGGLCVVAAGVAYAGPLWGLSWPASAILGLVLHMTWHVLDGADGDLARLTGRTSPRGEMIDGLSDYLSHAVLYALLAALLSRQIGTWAWGIALAAGIAHALQSNHIEVQRRFYLRWVYGKPWLAQTRPQVGGLAGRVVALYLEIAAALNREAPLLDAAITAAESDPARGEALRRAIREEWAPLIVLEKWLGPNQRALALGASMLLTRSPLAYFAFGGLWLSALLVVSIVAHDRAARRLIRRLAGG